MIYTHFLNSSNFISNIRGLTPVCKPNSVYPARRDEAAIYLDPALPRDSCDLPEYRFAEADTARATQLLRRYSYMVLLRVGFARPACYQTAGALLPHHFNLTPTDRGGMFSVALSVAFRRPDVIRHPALRSSDFPPLPKQRRLPDGHETRSQRLVSVAISSETRMRPQCSQMNILSFFLISRMRCGGTIL